MEDLSLAFAKANLRKLSTPIWNFKDLLSACIHDLSILYIHKTYIQITRCIQGKKINSIVICIQLKSDIRWWTQAIRHMSILILLLENNIQNSGRQTSTYLWSHKTHLKWTLLPIYIWRHWICTLPLLKSLQLILALAPASACPCSLQSTMQ